MGAERNYNPETVKFLRGTF